MKTPKTSYITHMPVLPKPCGEANNQTRELRAHQQPKAKRSRITGRRMYLELFILLRFPISKQK